MARGAALIAGVVLCGLLAGCARRPPWTKDGARPKRTAAHYAACNAQAQRDIGRDVNIDSDILAGRQSDWQRTSSMKEHTATDATTNSERTDDLVRFCMIGRGYAPTGTEPARNPS